MLISHFNRSFAFIAYMTVLLKSTSILAIGLLSIRSFPRM